MRLKNALLLTVLVAFPALSWAGPPHGQALPRRPVFNYYYVPYAQPILVVSPYGPAYVLPPTVVVTERYFCVLHNEGFITRIGLLDHLAGTHKIALDAASTLCPDGAASCVFPSY
ncbi:MAG TPA: hypothetical protein VNT76_24145 [Candidatus Binatus sp.]|nr:hypothetical protein [Candidatus Binatus sp.]